MYELSQLDCRLEMKDICDYVGRILVRIGNFVEDIAGLNGTDESNDSC
jgi:hypothetical protein